MIEVDKSNWKKSDRYIQTKAYISYYIDSDKIGVFPSNTTYPSNTLYPLSSIQKIDLLLDTIELSELEEIDVTTASIPSNELSLKVSDEQGLFDEFNSNSILKYLDDRTKITLYLIPDEDETQKVKLFEYDFTSAQENDDKTATLKCYGVFSYLQNIPFKTNTKAEVTSQNVSLERYLTNNYNLDVDILKSNICYSTLDLINNRYDTLYDVIWELIINTQNGFWFNDRNNKIRLVNRRNKIAETITNDLILEKVKVTKELNLDSIQINDSVSNVTVDTETSSFEFCYEGEVPIDKNITITSDEFNLNGLDFSTITCTNCSIEYMVKSTRYTCLKVNALDNANITIKINKTLNKLKTEKIDKLVIGKNSENCISINNPTNKITKRYYNDIVETYPISLHISTQIVGLPYLELGDVISIQTEYGEKIVNITKIEQIIGNGYKMNIEGYATDYDGLFPNNNLYPSNDLYPNMRTEK